MQIAQNIKDLKHAQLITVIKQITVYFTDFTLHVHLIGISHLNDRVVIHRLCCNVAFNLLRN